MVAVKVTILPRRETREVEAPDVAQLLKALDLRQEAFLVIRNDELLTRDVRLSPDDQVELWPVISGG
jgi:sulfur carrier protein